MPWLTLSSVLFLERHYKRYRPLIRALFMKEQTKLFSHSQLLIGVALFAVLTACLSSALEFIRRVI